jgi:hypothetical protein
MPLRTYFIPRYLVASICDLLKPVHDGTKARNVGDVGCYLAYAYREERATPESGHGREGTATREVQARLITHNVADFCSEAMRRLFS